MKRASKISLLVLILLLLSAILFGCNQDNHEHKWGSYFDGGDGTHYRICQTKSDHRESEPHIMSDYTVSKEPTDILPGSKYRKCLKCGYKETVSIAPTGDHVFDREVVAEEFLYKKTSDYSAVYYKSCECGAFGNPGFLFETSLLPEGYSDIGYIKGSGYQFIDTGIEYKEGTTIEYNVSKGLALRLPEGYKAVEYIEGDGTQVMPTNIIISSSYTITADVAVTDTDNSSTIWCSRGQTNSSYTSSAFYVSGSGVRGDYGINSTATYISNPSKNQRFTIEKDKNEWYIDGQLKKTCTEQTYTCPNELMFFASYYGDISSNVGNNSFMRMYSASVYDGKTPVAVFVPCFRESDRKAGLFDVCNGDFYTSVSGNNFATGQVIGTPVITPDTHSIEIEIPDELKGEKYNEFIKNYDLLEYIEATGSQWIDTEKPVHMNYHYTIAYKRNTATSSRIWGAFNQETYDGGFNCSLTYNKGDAVRWTTTGDNTHIIDSLYGKNYDTNVHIVDINKGEVTIDGVKKGITSGHSESGVSDYNAFLFAVNPGGSDVTSKFIGRIYFYTVYDNNGIPIQYFVPAESKTTKEAGFYDLIEGKFYSNQGTGNLFAGKSVNLMNKEYLESYKKFKAEYDALSYIESTGTQYINTGYTPGNTTGIEIEMMPRGGDDDRVIAGSRNTLDTRFWIGVVRQEFYFGWNLNVSVKDSLDMPFPKDEVLTLSMNFLNSRTRQFNGSDFGGELETHTTVCPVYIFTGNDNGHTSEHMSRDRIYSLKISEGTEIVRHFIPARSKATGETGLYDLVEGRFYVNEGTGEFIAGDTVSDIIPDNIFIGFNYSSIIPSYRYLKIYDALIKEGDKQHLLIPALRNSDSKIGMYDIDRGVFYTGDYALFEFEGLITHLSGTTEIIKEATFDEEGMSCFTCSICGDKIYSVLPKIAFKAEFEYDSGVDKVNVLNNPKSSEYEAADSAYTRNISSYNYSVINAGVVILPSLKEGYVLSLVTTDNPLAEIIINDSGIIEIRNIISDIKITITTKPAS